MARLAAILRSSEEGHTLAPGFIAGDAFDRAGPLEFNEIEPGLWRPRSGRNAENVSTIHHLDGRALKVQFEAVRDDVPVASVARPRVTTRIYVSSEVESRPAAPGTNRASARNWEIYQ